MIKFFLYLYLLTWPILAETIRWDPGGAGLPALDLYRPIPFLIAVAVIFNAATKNRRIKFDLIVGFTLVFVFYFIFNLVINGTGDSLRTFREIIVRFLVPVAVYFSLINLAPEINKRFLIHVFLFSGLYVAVVGIAEFIAGRNLIGPVGFVEENTIIHRTNGPFWDGIGYAGVVLTFIPFTYYSLKENFIRLPFANICFIVFSAGCLVNFSRAIWMAYIIIAVVLLVGKDIKSILLIFYGMVFMAIIVLLLGEVISSNEIVKSRFTDPRNIIGRYEQYLGAISLIKENLVFGMGHLMYWKQHPIDLHNSYLLVLVEFGLTGGFLFALYLFSILGTGFKQSIQQRNYLLKTRLSIILLVLVIPNTIHFLGNAYFMLTIFSMTALFNLSNSHRELVE